MNGPASFGGFNVTNNPPMTPKEFAIKMVALKSDDFECSHGEMDALMCELLKSLGYTDGVKVFQGQGKIV